MPRVTVRFSDDEFEQIREGVESSPELENKSQYIRAAVRDYSTTSGFDSPR